MRNETRFLWMCLIFMRIFQKRGEIWEVYITGDRPQNRYKGNHIFYLKIIKKQFEERKRI